MATDRYAPGSPIHWLSRLFADDGQGGAIAPQQNAIAPQQAAPQGGQLPAVNHAHNGQPGQPIAAPGNNNFQIGNPLGKALGNEGLGAFAEPNDMVGNEYGFAAFNPPQGGVQNPSFNLAPALNSFMLQSYFNKPTQMANQVTDIIGQQMNLNAQRSQRNRLMGILERALLGSGNGGARGFQDTNSRQGAGLGLSQILGG